MAGWTAGAGSAAAVELVLVVVGSAAGPVRAATGGSTDGGGSGGGSGALLMARTGWDNCSGTGVEHAQGWGDLPSSLLCCWLDGPGIGRSRGGFPVADTLDSTEGARGSAAMRRILCRLPAS